MFRGFQITKFGESDETADTGRVGKCVYRPEHHVGDSHLAQVNHQASDRAQGNTYTSVTCSSCRRI